MRDLDLERALCDCRVALAELRLTRVPSDDSWQPDVTAAAQYIDLAIWAIRKLKRIEASEVAA